MCTHLQCLPVHHLSASSSLSIAGGKNFYFSFTRNGLYLIFSCVDGTTNSYSGIFNFGKAIMFHPL